MDSYKGNLSQDVSLASHTSWKVGGLAKQCYQAFDLQDLSAFLYRLPREEPLFFLGLGTNTLVRDEGFKGTVILMKGSGLRNINVLHRLHLRVEAGVACPVLARFCAQQALTGLEFLVGIPGTVGGALAMNAGAHGSSIWDFVTQVETIDRYGVRRLRQPKEYTIGYRSVTRHLNEWFVAAELSLQSDAVQQCWERLRGVLAYRQKTQPNQPSAGSVFRNSQDYYAGELIEACGFKGTRCGGAIVSEKHANFIINSGGAKSCDVETLIESIQYTVLQRCGIALTPEVCIYPQ